MVYRWPKRWHGRTAMKVEANEVFVKSRLFLVLPDRIELSTSPLPMESPLRKPLIFRENLPDFDRERQRNIAHIVGETLACQEPA